MTQVNSRLGSQNTIKVIPSIGAATIGALRDVDTSNLGNGYVLVYDSATKKMGCYRSINTRGNSKFNHQWRKFLNGKLHQD